MSVVIVQPNANLAVPYVVPFNGRLRYEVESELAVTVMALDPVNLSEFRAGRPYTNYGSATAMPQTTLRQEATVPFRGQWFLVIVNFNVFPTPVHFVAWS